MIEKHGVRPGWEPFGQWSIKKAQEMARKEEQRKNQRDDESSAGSEEKSVPDDVEEDESASVSFASVCLNGECLWKIKSAYDDVQEEIISERLINRRVGRR